MWRIKVIFWGIPLLLALFEYKRSTNRLCIDSDLLVQNSKYKQNKSLSYYLLTDTYFRTLFYHRIGDSVIVNIIKIFLGPSNVFLISKYVSLGVGINYSHPVGSFLNAISIGDNFSFRQNTTIGNKIDGRNDLIPSIGNNVTLGANVCIIGDVTIGDNVIVGAGCVITKSVPSNSIVVGNPMRIIPKC